MRTYGAVFLTNRPVLYKGNLHDGDELESEASIVVIGDVEKERRSVRKKYRRLRGALAALTQVSAGMRTR